MIATAILSTTVQAKRRAKNKEKAQRRASMDLDPVPSKSSDKMDVDEEKKEEDTAEKTESEEKEAPSTPAGADSKKKPEKEKFGFDIDNMSRVLPGQLKYINFPAGRYKPVKKVSKFGSMHMSEPILTQSKPTGGPLLLHDTQPDEPKILLEEMLKKVTTERAPVAGQQNGRNGGARMAGARDLLGALQTPSGSTNAMVDQLLGSSRSPFDMITDDVGDGSGAATAAGVLTAVDEDGEDDEEAEVPNEFEYFSDATDSDD